MTPSRRLLPLAAAALLALPLYVHGDDEPPQPPPQTWAQFQQNQPHAGRMDRNTAIFRQLQEQLEGTEGHLSSSAQVHVSPNGNVTVRIPMANGQTIMYAPSMRAVPPNAGQAETMVLHNPDGQPELVRLQAPTLPVPGAPPPLTVDVANRDDADAYHLTMQVAPGQITQALANQILASLESGGAAHQIRQLGLSGPAPGPETWTGDAPARLEGLRTWTGEGTPPQGYWTMPNGTVRYFDGQSRTGTWIGERQAFATRDGGTVSLLVVRPPERAGQTVNENSQVWSVYAANGVRLWADTYSWNALQRELGSSGHLGDIAQRAVHGEGNRLLIPTAYGADGHATRVVDARTGEILDLTRHGGVAAYVPNPSARAVPPPAEGQPRRVVPPAALAFRSDAAGEGMALENGVLAYYSRGADGTLQRAEVGSVYQVPVGGGARPVDTIHFRGLPGQSLPNGGAMFTMPRGARDAPQQASLIGAWNGLGTGNTWNAWGRPLAGGGSAPLVPLANTNNDARGNRASIERQFVDLRTGEHYVLDLSRHTGVFRPVPQPGRPAEAEAGPAAVSAPALTEVQRGQVTTAVAALRTAFVAPIAGRSQAIESALQGLRFSDDPRMRGLAAGELLGTLTSDTPILQRAQTLAALSGYFAEMTPAQQERLRAQILGQLGGTLGTNSSALTPEGGYWPHDVYPAFEGLIRSLGNLGPEVRAMRIGERSVDEFLRFHAGAAQGSADWVAHHNRTAAVDALLGLGTNRREVARLAVPQLLRAAADTGLYRDFRTQAMRLVGSLPVYSETDRNARVTSLTGLLSAGGAAADPTRAALPPILQRLTAGLPADNPARLQAVTALQTTVLNTALPEPLRAAAREALRTLNPPTPVGSAPPPGQTFQQAADTLGNLRADPPDVLAAARRILALPVQAGQQQALSVALGQFIWRNRYVANEPGQTELRGVMELAVHRLVDDALAGGGRVPRAVLSDLYSSMLNTNADAPLRLVLTRELNRFPFQYQGHGMGHWASGPSVPFDAPFHAAREAWFTSLNLPR